MSIARRLSVIEAKLPQISPVEAVLCDEPWFLDFLTSHNLDIDHLKQKGSIIAVIPLRALQDLRERLMVMRGQE
jgi:hypothetical protein